MTLETYLKNQSLVSVYRDGLDSNRIQGFILGYSEDLIFLHYVYDFRLDGLMVLRRSEISEIELSKTDKFQKELLIKEGVFSKVDFSLKYPLTSWHDFIKYASSKHRYFVFEEELLEEPSFVIGKVESINSEKLHVKYFTGIARWEDELSVVDLSELTSCQISNNYLNVYERYFEGKNA